MTDQLGAPPDPARRSPHTGIGPSQMTGPLVAISPIPDRVSWLKWIDRFSTLLAVLGGVATIGLMLNVVLDVLGRYFFNRPFPGTLDMAQFAWMPTLVSLGLGYALLRGEHIRVNLLTAPTGPRTQRIIEIVAMAFTLGTTALFIWFGAEKAAEAMEFGEKAVGTPWLLIWPFRWVIVVGMVALFLQAAALLIRAITVEEFRPNDDDELISVIADDTAALEELPIGDASAPISTTTTVRPR